MPSIRPCALALLALPWPCWGQWVSFSDDTATRLTLSTLPANDNQEKDIAFADFDKDGWTDFVVVRKEPFSNPGKRQDLLLMNEGGVLVDRTAQYAPGFLANFTDARDVLCADFDGDTWPDIVVCTTFDDTIRFYRNAGSSGSGWLGLVDETSRIGPIGTSPIRMCGVGAGDVDGDLDLDLYFANYEGGDDVLMINDGTGHFTDQTVARLGSYANVAFGTGVGMFDMDEDGDTDIVKISTLFSASPFGIGIYLLWNDGSGVFNSIPFSELPNTVSPYMFGVADFNGDKHLDVYVVQDPQDQVVLAQSVQQHNITWTSKQVASPRTSGFGGNVMAADIDRDGDLDMGVGPIDVDIKNCGVGAEFALLRNDGTGALSDPFPSKQNFHLDCHDFAFVDINADGCLDLFMGLCTGYRVFIQNNCPCYPDCDNSGVLDIFDFFCFTNAFNAQAPAADCDANGIFDIFDFLCFTNAFNTGCP